jgi:hypothetical protein
MPPRLLEGAHEQELDLGVDAAQLVVGPAAQGLVEVFPDP